MFIGGVGSNLFFQMQIEHAISKAVWGWNKKKNVYFCFIAFCYGVIDKNWSWDTQLNTCREGLGEKHGLFISFRQQFSIGKYLSYNMEPLWGKLYLCNCINCLWRAIMLNLLCALAVSVTEPWQLLTMFYLHPCVIFFEFSTEPCCQLLPNLAEDRKVNKSSSLKDPVTNFKQLSTKCWLFVLQK